MRECVGPFRYDSVLEILKWCREHLRGGDRKNAKARGWRKMQQFMAVSLTNSLLMWLSVHSLLEAPPLLKRPLEINHFCRSATFFGGGATAKLPLLQEIASYLCSGKNLVRRSHTLKKDTRVGGIRVEEKTSSGRGRGREKGVGGNRTKIPSTNAWICQQNRKRTRKAN